MKKKKISPKDFDKKVKVWGLLVPLVVAVLTSITSIYVNRQNPQQNLQQKAPELKELIMSGNNQIDVNKLSLVIKELMRLYIQSTNEEEKKNLDKQLRLLAEEEAKLMRVYNPDYVSRWPLEQQTDYAGSIFKSAKGTTREPYSKNVLLFASLLASIFLAFLSYRITKGVLQSLYEIEPSYTFPSKTIT